MLGRAKQRFVVRAPLGRHVGAEVGGRHDGTAGSRRRAVAHCDDVAQETGRASRVHHVCHAALEVGVALVQHRNAERAGPMWDAGELVPRAPAREAELVDQLELVVAQQVQDETPRLEYQVVTEVEFVDVD